MNDKHYLLRSIQIAAENVARGGQPFGAVLVRDGQVLAEGVNETYLAHDPTAHAEIQALRNASQAVKSSHHAGSTMYASGIPCPMCMAAMIASGVERVVYCADDKQGQPFGWSTESFYKKMQQDFGKQGVKMEHLPLPEKRQVYETWQARFGQGSKQD